MKHILFALLVATLLSFVTANASNDTEIAAAYNYTSDGDIIFHPDENLGTYASFKQCDARWANQQLGCAMSSVAMYLVTKGVKTNPAHLDSWLTRNGGYVYGCDIIWGRVDAFGKTSFKSVQRASEQEICHGLSLGHGIIANVNNGGHWVLLTGCKGHGVFTVHDPGFSRSTYHMSEISQEAVYH